MQKTVKLYDGNVTLHFSDSARNRYTIEETGSSPVGVTTVLQLLAKPGLMLWPLYEGIAHLKVNVGDFEGAAKAYLTKSDAGKDAGTLIHGLIEAYLRDKTVEVPLQAVRALEGFRRWHSQQTNPKTIAVEQICYSKEHNYAGTMDGIMEIDGQTILFDIKTNNASRVAPLGIYPEHFLQLGAYANAWWEQSMYDEESERIIIDDLAIIRVGKDGIVNTLRASELGLSVPDCEQAWLSVLEAYRFLTPLTKKLKEM